jgi:hypothetical protein
VERLLQNTRYQAIPSAPLVISGEEPPPGVWCP